MTNEKTETGGKEPRPAMALLFVPLVLFINAGLFVFLFLAYYEIDYPQHTAVWTIYLVFALYNLVGMVGIFFRRGFGKTLAEILLVFDFVMVIRYPWAPLGLLSILALLSFYSYRKILVFKEKDKLNKYVYWGMAVALFIPLIFYMNPSLVPRLYQTAGEITTEAIQKNDIDICNKAGVQKSGCIRVFAENKRDSKLCGKINDSDYQADLCYLHVADSTKNPELCPLIKNDYDKKMCGDFSKS